MKDEGESDEINTASPEGKSPSVPGEAGGKGEDEVTWGCTEP